MKRKPIAPEQSPVSPSVEKTENKEVTKDKLKTKLVPRPKKRVAERKVTVPGAPVDENEKKHPRILASDKSVFDRLIQKRKDNPVGPTTEIEKGDVDTPEQSRLAEVHIPTPASELAPPSEVSTELNIVENTDEEVSFKPVPTDTWKARVAKMDNSKLKDGAGLKNKKLVLKTRTIKETERDT